MEHRFSRTELLIGKEALARLKTARVAVFGVGGVGGYAVEALARSGVGSIDLIDHDKISISNLQAESGSDAGKNPVHQPGNQGVYASLFLSAGNCRRV